MSKADQVRQLLSSYYGTYGEETEDSTLQTLHSNPTELGALQQPAAPGLVLSPAEAQLLANVKAVGIDSAAFDADNYVGNVLGQQGYQPLLHKFVQELAITMCKVPYLPASTSLQSVQWLQGSTSCSKVSSEVKTLDSDMQMLIYENYNQFIAALDVIKELRSKTTFMQESMTNLQDKIDSFAQGTGALAGKFRSRKQQMEQMAAACRLAAALEAALNLPVTLQNAVRVDNLDLAVQQYAALAPVLKRFSHKGAFRKAHHQVEQQRRLLVAQLQQQLLGSSAQSPHTSPTPGHQYGQALSVAEQCAYVQHLRALGENMDALFDDMLACYTDRMGDLVADAHLQAEALTAANTGAVGAAPVSIDGAHEAVERLLDTLLQDTSDTVQVLGVAFGEPSDESEMDTGSRNATVRRTVAAAVEKLLDAVAAVLVAAAGRLAYAAQRELDSNVQQQQGLGVGEVAGVQDWGVDALAHMLQGVDTQLQRLEDLSIGLQLQQRGTELRQHVIQCHADACFQALATCALSLFVGCWNPTGAQPQEARQDSSTLTTPLLRCHTLLTQLLCSGLEALLKGMRQYARQESLLDGWHHVFSIHMQRNTSTLLYTMLAAIRRFLHVPTLCPVLEDHDERQDDNVNTLDWVSAVMPAWACSTPVTMQRDVAETGLLLLASRTCTMVADVAVPQALEVLAIHFPDRGPSAQASTQGAPPPLNPTRLARTMQQYAQAMLEAFVLQQGLHAGYVLNAAWQACLVGYRQGTQDTADDNLEELALQLLRGSEQHVVHLIDDGGRCSNSSQAPLSTDGNLTGRRDSHVSALERHVARLFKEHVRVFSPVEATQASLLQGICKAVLKLLVDEVRRHSLTGSEAVVLEGQLRGVLRAVQTILGGIETPAVQQLAEELLHTVAERTLEQQ